MPNLVVYCVQTGAKGDFDGFGVASNPNYDLVLLTDDPSLRGEGFRTQLIDDRGLDPSRSSRHPKLQPHRYFPTYEWSLYIDGNAVLKADPHDVLSACAARPENLFAFRHPNRRCIFDEAEVLIGQDYDREEVIRLQMDHYRQLGMPKDCGLIAGTFLLRRHNEPDVAGFGEEWYEHVLRFSKRDQLSFGFVCWRRAFHYGLLPGELSANDYMVWPRRPRNQRVTSDFDEGFYARQNRDVAQSGLSPREHFLRRRRGKESVGPYKPHSWSLRKLANKHRCDMGTLYGSAHNYADIYESLLKGRREEPLRVLQIGLGQTEPLPFGSGEHSGDAPRLKVWAEYLPNGRIFGLDVVELAIPALPERTEVWKGLLPPADDLAGPLREEEGGFDLIVDSATCTPRQRQITMSALFDRLNRGGLYAIENLHLELPDPEEAALATTAKMIRTLARGKTLASAAVTAVRQAEFLARLHDLLTFDSWSRESGRVHRDTLAILRVKSG